MKLYKSENAIRGKGITKFSLKCEEEKDKWFNLLNILYKNDNYTAVVLKGLYDNKKDIVIKVGIKEAIDKEYEIAEKINKLPNFIRYYCKFICFDDIRKIIKNEDMITTYYLCKNGTKEIGILTMNYYKLGSIGSYNWNNENITLLKNVLRQSIYAYLFAYYQNGFIHGDFHCDNILLKNKKVCKIDYTFKKLEIDTLEIRIMDFEKSRLNKDLEFKFVLSDVEKLLNSISVNERYTVKFNYKSGILRKMKNKIMIENINAYSLNESHFNNLDLVIDSFYIEYTK
jgi:serine/threonine protein kinase